MKNLTLLVSALIAISCAAASTAAPDKARQQAVAERGAEVMPFDLAATTHVFTKTNSGGIQEVVVKSPGDVAQIGQIRQHLKHIAQQFSNGDFSAPAHIHGAQMPGLAELQGAGPGQVEARYRETPAGAEIVFTAKRPELVAALHQWFGAQLADHGKDAMAGHDHSAMHH